MLNHYLNKSISFVNVYFFEVANIQSQNRPCQVIGDLFYFEAYCT